MGLRPGGAFMGFMPKLSEVLKASGRADQAAMRNLQDLNTVGSSLVAVGGVIAGGAGAAMGLGLAESIAAGVLQSTPRAISQLGNGIQAGLIAEQNGALFQNDSLAEP